MSGLPVLDLLNSVYCVRFQGGHRGKRETKITKRVRALLFVIIQERLEIISGDNEIRADSRMERFRLIAQRASETEKVAYNRRKINGGG